VGFFYSNKNGNKVFGYKFTIKFGKGSPLEDRCESMAYNIVNCLEKLGLSVIKDSDQDPNKDKHIL